MRARWAGGSALVRKGTDVAGWALLTAIALAEIASVRETSPAAEGLAMALLLALAFGLRRRRPHTALALAVTALVLQGVANIYGLVAPIALSYTLPVLVLAFLAGRASERSAPPVIMFLTACATTLGAYAVQWVTWGDLREALSGTVDWSGGVLLLLATLIAPWLLGRYWRQHTELLSTGWEVAKRMERARDLDAERARLRERARIAAEMHDSLGHHLTLIGIRAAALEMAADSGTHRAAAELRSATHEATLRLREIIGVLREDATPAVEEPAEEVTTLVARATEAGMEIRLVREGPDPDPATPAGRAVHRVVQEALTNAAKHAPGTPVTVRVTRGADGTTVRVDNERPSRGTGGGGTGSGLVGLRSLVEGLDGTFHAGPSDDDSTVFTVLARVADTAEERTEKAPPHGRALAAGEADIRSEAARQQERIRARARRRLLIAVGVPLAAVGAVTAGGFLLLWYVGINSVLPPSVYGELRVGDSQAHVEEVLPRFDYPERSVSDPPPPPPGSSCRYYLVTWENGLPPVYRLCFAEGRLVAKEEIRRE